MKNWEKYENEIKKGGLINIAIPKNSGKIAKCNEIDCDDCLLCKIGIDCRKELTKWLYSDYKEPVVLTEDERKLCELLSEGWIARDANGDVYFYVFKPRKGANMWLEGVGTNITGMFPQCKFEFIKWEDEKPWEVEKLVK